MEKDYFASNIRNFRRRFNISQEQLGAAVGLTNKAISNYEVDGRHIDILKRKKIADYIGISVEDLTNIEFPFEIEFNLDEKAFGRYIEQIFPTFSSESALTIASFRRAYSNHNEMYKRVKKDDFNIFNEIAICSEDYEKAMENELSNLEATANYVALWFLLFYLLYTQKKIIDNNTAMIEYIMKTKPQKQREIEDIADDDFKKELSESMDSMKKAEETKKIIDMLVVLKNSKKTKYSELSYYYIALQYLINAIDNELGEYENQRIGFEMMLSFSSINNHYTKTYLKFNDEVFGL